MYCEIIPYTTSIEDIKSKNPKGIIFTGGPNSVYGDGAPRVDKEIFELGVPVLGICYGHQLTAYTLGGKVESPEIREYGKTEVKINNKSELFKGINEIDQSWMSHTDYVSQIPEGFEIIATTDQCPVAAMENKERKYMEFNSTQK